MKHVPLRFWVMAISLIAVNIAGWAWVRFAPQGKVAPPKLRLLSVSPTGDVDEADRFTLRFDEPVIAEAMCRRPVDAAPFVIEPQPPGHWRWEQPDQLVYLLDEKLPPGRRWTIRPADHAETTLGRRLIGEAEFQFSTRPLRIDNVHINSADRSHVNMTLRFNQPVRPADLLRHAKATENQHGQPLTITCPANDADAELPLRIERPRSNRFTLSIDEALHGHGGELTMRSSYLRGFTLEAPFAFRSASVHQPGAQTNVTVDLGFNAALDADQTLPRLSLSPEVSPLTARSSGNAIRLEGAFEIGRRYTVTIPATVLAKGGQTLGSAATAAFDIPNRSPVLSLPVGRGILMPDGNLTLDLKAVNVDTLKLTAWRVHGNNVVAHVRGGRVGSTSRQLFEKEITLDLPKNEPHTVALELKDIIAQHGPGMYRVQVRAERPHWLRDDAVVAVTDLALTTKRQKDRFDVWVTSLRTGKPVEGVSLAAVTYSNQTVGEATTDTDGLATLPAPANHPDGKVFIITAQLGADVSFIQPDRRQWVLDDVDQSGRAYPATYDVMLYTDRGVYRPGETIHLTGIVREPDGAVPPPLPLSLRVKRPDGRQITELAIPGAQNQQGVFHIDVPTDADGQLGAYRFYIGLPGDKAVLGQAEALVEAFVPVRIEVKAVATQNRYGPDETPTVNVDAQYLFGQPAAKLPIRIAPTLRPIDFKSARFGDFTFSDPHRAAQPINAPIVEATLGDNGEAEVAINPFGGDNDGDREKPRPGLWRAACAVTVTEPGGRSVSRQTSFVIDQTDRHVGLDIGRSRFAPIGEPAAARWCFVNGEDGPVAPGPVRYELVRVEYDWVLEEVNGSATWKTHERRIEVSSKRLDAPAVVDGIGEIAFTCPQYGNYELTLVEIESGAAARIAFVAASQRDEPQAPATTPQRVTLTLDRPKYTPGNTATLHIASPFTGTLLLTVETDRIVQRFVKTLATKSQTIELPVDTSIRGCAYISASVVRPIDPSQNKWLPHRANGMAKLLIDHAANRPTLILDAPAQAEPGQTITVNVQTESPRDPDAPPMLHIWAVDDGILLTTSYRTPDPLNHFLAPREAVIATSDAFADLLPDHARPAEMRRIGGDDVELDKDGRVRLRRSPVPMKQKAPAVVWRTAAPVGADGRGSVSMLLPGAGRMRVMAVLIDHDRYASTDHAVTVTAPLLVEASWPRFAAPGDRFDVPVKLFNATEEALAASLAVEVSGPVELIGFDASTPIAVNPGEPATVWLSAKATGLGPVDVKVRATANTAAGRALTAANDAAFAVRPITPLHSETKLVRIKAGDSLELATPDAFEPRHTRISVSISGRPDVELRPALEQLLDYPYGCVEQTTSRLLAILYAPQLLATDSQGDGRTAEIRQMIDAGIARLWSMQTRRGGLAYWPGGTEPNRWGTAYAAECLVRAKQAGHGIDKRFTEELCEYLLAELNDTSAQRPDANERALICRVLAAFDRPQRGWMSKLTEDANALDIAGRAHLAAAWLSLGRRDKAAALITDDPLAQRIATTTVGRFTSQARQEAVLLDVMLDFDPKHEWVTRLARRLYESRDNGQWGTTLSNASALAALAKYQAVSQRGKTAFTGSVAVGDVEALSFGHEAPARFDAPVGEKPIVIHTQGEGDVYVTVTYEGLARPGVVNPYDHNLEVRRRWLGRDGEPIDPAKLRVGDLIHVEIQIATPGMAEDGQVGNIAIVDALPAGLEVENPRLATSANAGDEARGVDRVEFLDDRVVLFTTAQRQPRTVRYLLRVITRGEFALPPVQASCMYDPAIASMGEAGSIIVRE